MGGQFESHSDMTKSPLLSVVVLGYNHFNRTTGPCLDSLRPWIEDPNIEIIVFDNASPDGSGDKTREWCDQHPRTVFRSSPDNLGYAGGMNKAAIDAQGKWLLLTNNDTIFPLQALDAMKRTILSAPTNMAMLGPITNAAGNGQRLYDPSKSQHAWIELGNWLNTHPTGLYLPTYRCDFFCVAIRHDVWELLQGLDQAFGRGYYEDFDFSLRLRQAGFDQAITEDVFIFHQGSATFSTTSEQKALMKRNKNLMRRRYPDLKLPHVRQCNLDVLRTYPTDSPLSLMDDRINVRKQIRQLAARLDQPKSLLKRLYWSWQLSRYEKTLMR